MDKEEGKPDQGISVDEMFIEKHVNGLKYEVYMERVYRSDSFVITGAAESGIDLDLLESDSKGSHSNQDDVNVQCNPQEETPPLREN